MSSNRQFSFSALLVSDADNTLWDTNALYAQAQLYLLERIEIYLQRVARAADRLAFVRSIDEELTILHNQELGYPPEMLVIGIAEGLTGVSAKQAAQRAIRTSPSSFRFPVQDLVRSFLHHVQDQFPELRPGVAEALPLLHSMGILIVIATEGKVVQCEKILAHHGFSSFVSRVVEGKKTRLLFSNIAETYDHPHLKFAVGDQLGRDIHPAKASGYATIYFPGGFRPSWESRDVAQSDYTISSFAEVCPIILPRRCSVSS